MKIDVKFVYGQEVFIRKRDDKRCVRKVRIEEAIISCIGVLYEVGCGERVREKEVFTTPQEAFAAIKEYETNLKPIDTLDDESESVRAWVEGRTAVRDAKGRFCK